MTLSLTAMSGCVPPWDISIVAAHQISVIRGMTKPGVWTGAQIIRPHLYRQVDTWFCQDGVQLGIGRSPQEAWEDLDYHRLFSGRDSLHLYFYQR